MTIDEGPQYVRIEEATPYVTQEIPVTPVAAVAAPVVAAPVVAPNYATTSLTRRFAVDALIAAIVGVFWLLLGLIAITRAGFDGPMDQPVVRVLGFTHTSTLGLIEIGIGLCLLIAGASRSRSAEMFFGAVLAIGAFVGAVQTTSFHKQLALEAGLAWLGVLSGLAVVLAALLIPRYVSTETVTHTV